MLSQTRSLTTRAAVKAVAKRGAATLTHWSETLSFASPESDFTRSQRDYTTRASSSPMFSNTLSYASPESDFTARSAHSLTEHQASHFENQHWSHQLSFASPESDFTFDAVAATKEAPAPEWSHTLSFASPESDFVAVSQHELTFSQERQHQKMPDNFYAMAMAASPETALGSYSLQEIHTGPEWSHTLSFASPESDFVASSQQGDDYKFVQDHHDIPESFFAMAMAASPESAFGSIAMPEVLDERMKFQLREVLEGEQMQMQEEAAIQAALPKTLAEAMAEQDPRAIVITSATAPFEIIHVNNAWEGLCGFTKEEAVHHTLSMLQGPETDRQQTIRLLHELQQGHAASAVITNYTKQGRAFTNLVRVAPIRDASRRISHFVGVLEEMVSQSQWDHHDDGHHNMRAA